MFPPWIVVIQQLRWNWKWCSQFVIWHVPFFPKNMKSFFCQHKTFHFANVLSCFENWLMPQQLNASSNKMSMIELIGGLMVGFSDVKLSLTHTFKMVLMAKAIFVIEFGWRLFHVFSDFQMTCDVLCHMSSNPVLTSFSMFSDHSDDAFFLKTDQIVAFFEHGICFFILRGVNCFECIESLMTHARSTKTTCRAERPFPNCPKAATFWDAREGHSPQPAFTTL